MINCIGLLGKGSAASPGKAMTKKGAAADQTTRRIDFLRASMAVMAGAMALVE
jgi:hypothetical protein